MVYQTPTKSYQRHIPVAFGIPDHVIYQTPTRHALLGSGRPPKTKLLSEVIKTIVRPCKCARMLWTVGNGESSLKMLYTIARKKTGIKG